MTENTPHIFKIEKRFLRSTNLERDWSDPNALEDYVITDLALQGLKMISKGLRENSSLRAWRITGDYGTGKSSFALFLAHVFERQQNLLPKSLLAQLKGRADFLSENKSPRLAPLLITGRKEPIKLSLLNALIKKLQPMGFPLVDKWISMVRDNSVTDRVAIHAVILANEFLIQQELCDGLFIILDEAGKYLEMAVLNPDTQDIFILQELAEVASRSGANTLLILAVFHQGINAYAQNLPVAQQREWEKIAGRYDEILWNQPIGQVAELIAAALNVQSDMIPKKLVDRSRADMNALSKTRWFDSRSHAYLLENHASLFPLHLTVIPVLVKVFAVYGQNERSLFTFLLGGEPYGLQDFVALTGAREFFKLDNLYDYVRVNLGSRMNQHSFRNHWREIDSSISMFTANDELELKVLKCIGLLNILNSESLIASNELLKLALGEDDVDLVIEKLRTSHLIFNRGISQGLCLWPHSSVNLERAYREAVQQNPSISNVIQSVQHLLGKRPIVARKHYIETGNLRFFEVVYCQANNITDHLAPSNRADGRIVIPLSEDTAGYRELTQFASSEKLASSKAVVIAIPRPLRGIEPFLIELKRWEWVDRNTSGLQRDSFAKEEVDRQIAFARSALNGQLQSLLGVANFQSSELSWFWMGRQLEGFNSQKAILRGLSEIFDTLFCSSPKIFNELINRTVPSSAANKVKMALIERIMEAPSLPYLGLDATKRPPEFSMYLSVLRATNVHRSIDQRWVITIPEGPETDICNLAPVFRKLDSCLRERSDERVSVHDLYQELQRPPYGVRSGLLPLILVIYYVTHEDELAFYEDQTFVTRMTAGIFFRLAKSPETFEIQLFPNSTVRSELFIEIANEILVGIANKARIELLDVVRPILVFVASLPQYTQRSSSLSENSLKVRDILSRSRDPARLLFIELPKVLGVDELSQNPSLKSSDIQIFVHRLRDCIDELRACYPNLLAEIGNKLREELQSNDHLSEVRANVEVRIARIVNFVTEIRLKGFCLRLADASLPEDKWIESLASYVCSMPPSKWKDSDLQRYHLEIHELVSKLLRVEAVAHSTLNQIQGGGFEAIRVFLTQVDGQEREKVLHISSNDKMEMEVVEQKLRDVLEPAGTLGVAALSKVLWTILEESKM